MSSTISISNSRTPIVQIAHALESARDSGFDLSTAGGEIVDNSFQSNAKIIRIATKESKTGIDAVAFADDGSGIAYDILDKVLSLGYSTRYNERDGLGRFGVGLKLASLSQARRVDIYTRPIGSSKIYQTFLDLDLVKTGVQEFLDVQEHQDFPRDYRSLMTYPDGDPEAGKPFESGTLVLWTKTDRLQETKKYGSSNNERKAEFLKFLGRAYRKFLDNGFKIELNGTSVTLHDPTFQLENPRITKRFGKDLRGEVVHEGIIDLDNDGKNNIHYIVTVVPEEFRAKRGIGGADYSSLSLITNEVQGRISLVRQGREIYYEIIPKMFPTLIQDIDRFIGIEVSFPATLDEYFQVRNVKRGAEPVLKLRTKLKEALTQPIKSARDKIKKLHTVNSTKQRADEGNGHGVTVQVAARADATLPQGRGGFNQSDDEINTRLRSVLKSTGTEPTDENVECFRKRLFDSDPISFRDGGWPGKEMLDIDHINGRVIITLNHNHPLIANVYDQVSAAVKQGVDNDMSPDTLDLLRKVEAGFDALFLGYGKAENMARNPDQAYGELRNYWGTFTASFVSASLKGLDD